MGQPLGTAVLLHFLLKKKTIKKKTTTQSIRHKAKKKGRQKVNPDE